ncbi:MAG: outer membrane beta-barrel protein [Granulosicoccaceae bacterium]
MKKLLGGLVLSLGMMAGSAQAAAPAKMYYGFSVADSTVEGAAAVDADESMGTISGTLGFQLLDFIGIELEVGSSSDQASSVISDPVFTYQAGMIRLGYRWDRAGVYMLGGQARFDSDGSDGSADSENVVGFGLNLFGNETTALNVHFLRFGDGEITTAGIGFQYYFGGFR